jgi:molybdopterin converting factor small subunit
LKVKLRLNGLLAASAGFKEKTIDLPEGITIGETIQYIGLPVSGVWTRSSVNGKLKEKTYVLQEGDDLLFFPVGGGG